MFDRAHEGRWWDFGWQLVEGCTPVTEGCKNCWSLAKEKRFRKETGVVCHPERLERPTKRKKPASYAIWNDLFHEKVPFEFVDEVMAVIGETKHVYQILTKRPERMKRYFSKEGQRLSKTLEYVRKRRKNKKLLWARRWPWSNVWLGTSISTQADADKNIPILLQIPAAVRFVSLEPMIERVDLTDVHPKIGLSQDVLTDFSDDTKKFNKDYAGHLKSPLIDDPRLDWVIIGCESGPGARLCSIEDIRDAVEQCREANVPVFVKQVPINGKCNKNPYGGPKDRWPEDLRIQEYPK